MNSTCAICSQSFIARHSYGLCPSCFSKDRARELDRLTSAINALRRQNVTPITLTLCEWLSVISDNMGLCIYCKQYQHSLIEMVHPGRGLTYDNAVPICRACNAIRRETQAAAEHRVRSYLQEDRIPKVIPQNEEELTESL